MTWKTARAVDDDGQIDLGRIYHARRRPGGLRLRRDRRARSDRTAQMVVGSDDTLTVWLNGKQVYDFADRRGYSSTSRHGST